MDGEEGDRGLASFADMESDRCPNFALLAPYHLILVS